MNRIRPAAWLMAAVALFLLAVAGYALLVHASPQYYWTQIDAAVYRDGGIAVRNQPAMLYALKLGPAKLPFIYTPFAALLLAAASGASFATWQVGLAVITIGLLPAPSAPLEPMDAFRNQFLNTFSTAPPKTASAGTSGR